MPPRKRGDRVEEIGTYQLSDESKPKRRYRPMPGVKASSDREPDEFDKPVLKRFLGNDPFPWAVVLCVLMWVGLGLAASRIHPAFAGLLFLAGMAVIVLSQVWLYASIFLEDLEAGVLSFVCGFYRIAYLYQNPDLTWRPGVLTVMGLLMIVTAGALMANRAINGE